MEITWYGLGCFRIMERGYPAVVTDPFDEDEVGWKLPKARVDIVTYSVPLDEPQEASWKGLRGSYRVLASPGEYEIGGLFVTGINTYRDRKKGAERGENVIYVINFNGDVVCHLGEMASLPTQTQLETIGIVHVLLLPVGIPGGLTPSMASEVVSLIEPDIVVPLNYRLPGWDVKRNSVTRFLKEMGVATKVPAEPSLKVSGGSGSEEIQVVLLESQAKK